MWCGVDARLQVRDHQGLFYGVCCSGHKHYVGHHCDESVDAHVLVHSFAASGASYVRKAVIAVKVAVGGICGSTASAGLFSGRLTCFIAAATAL